VVPLLSLIRLRFTAPAQILLRWASQRGIAVIPKSSNPDRAESNFQSEDFTIEQEDVETITAMDKGIRFNDPSNMSLRFSIFA
jgi:D-xylose reductase